MPAESLSKVEDPKPKRLLATLVVNGRRLKDVELDGSMLGEFPRDGDEGYVLFRVIEEGEGGVRLARAALLAGAIRPLRGA
jgi:hypothetical protein